MYVIYLCVIFIKYCWRLCSFLTFTNATDAVEVVARLTLTAVGANQVDTTVTRTHLLRSLTLVNICGPDVIVRK